MELQLACSRKEGGVVREGGGWEERGGGIITSTTSRAISREGLQKRGFCSTNRAWNPNFSMNWEFIFSKGPPFSKGGHFEK